MEIDLDIKTIKLDREEYDSLAILQDGVTRECQENIKIVFESFHDTLLGEVRIILKKSGFPWPSTVGVIILRSATFKNLDSSVDHIFPILEDGYENKINSYKFEKKKYIGAIQFSFTRRFIVEEDKNVKFQPNGFVEQMFNYFFTEKKAGMMLSVKKVLENINMGSNVCKFNIFIGGLLVEKYLANVNERLTKDINLIVEHGDLNGENVPIIVKRAMIVENVSMDEMKNKKVFTIVEKGCEWHKKIQKTNFGRILCNKNYAICDISMLTYINRLMYFSVGSYGNSWPSFFVDPQVSPNSFDKSISLKRRTILGILAIKNEDLLKMNIDSDDSFHHIIFYDEIEDRIVISFKGTTNSDETIRDIHCEYTRFMDGYAHKGFLEYAEQFIYSHFSVVNKLLEKRNTKRLLLTGHSLGGAVAILVKLVSQLKNILPDIEIETVAFSAPPVVSMDIAENFCDNITSIVYGNDLVPRMSFGSVLELKYLCCSIGENNNPLQKDEIIEEQIDIIMKHIKRTNMFPKLYQPGKLIHIKRIRCKIDDNTTPIVIYKEVDKNFFENVILIKHAPKHHTVNHILNVFQEGITRYKLYKKNGM